jgi:hypothetical protein
LVNAALIKDDFIRRNRTFLNTARYSRVKIPFTGYALLPFKQDVAENVCDGITAAGYGAA